jgi:outer membrane lipoprotein-sorting protein
MVNGNNNRRADTLVMHSYTKKMIPRKQNSPKTQERALLSLAIAICISTPTHAALASTPKRAALIENFTQRGPMAEGMTDGRRIIDELYKHAQALNDYSLYFEMTVFRKSSVVNERGHLYFKKPRLLRVEETGQYNTGSVVVIGKDGKAHGHAGGLAKFITITRNPNDSSLRASNGDALTDSDFASLGAHLKNLLHNGMKSRVSSEPLTINGVSQPTYVLELYSPENPRLVAKRIFVDPNTYLPLRWDDYDYKDPCASLWKNVRTNIGLSDDLFSL